MAITKSPQLSGRCIVYLIGKDGELRSKEFDTLGKADKYIHKRHDSVVHYMKYLVSDIPGEALFIKEGGFKPRTKAMLQKSKARLRRKKKARRKARQAEAEENAKMRPTRW